MVSERQNCIANNPVFILDKTLTLFFRYYFIFIYKCQKRIEPNADQVEPNAVRTEPGGDRGVVLERGQRANKLIPIIWQKRTELKKVAHLLNMSTKWEKVEESPSKLFRKMSWYNLFYRSIPIIFLERSTCRLIQKIDTQFFLWSENKMLVQIFQIIWLMAMAYLIDVSPTLAAVCIGPLILRLFESHD